MPEYLRALVVILGLSIPLMALLKRPAFGLPLAAEDFSRRRNLWLAITVVAFVAHSFWVYVLVTSALLFQARRREHNAMALYLFLLYALPPFSASIEGLGPIEQLFGLSHIRLLSLFVLLPAWLALRREVGSIEFGRFWADRLMLGYLVYQLILTFSGLTFTNAIRQGVFYSFTDVFLPYIVASRYLRTQTQLREAIASLTVAMLILAVLGIFETARGWLLYSTLDDVLGVSFGMGNYIVRGDVGVRATVTAGHGIAFGYVLSISLMLYTSLKFSMRNTTAWWIGATLLGLGLIMSLSRGPWVGAAGALLFYLLLSANRLQDCLKFAAAAIVIILGLFLSPYQNQVIDLIPFIGSLESGNVDYRKDLFSTSLLVIKQNLLFGSNSYMGNPLMQQLIQGEGIIDLVNTYVAVALAQGLIGLGLFVGIFLTAAGALYRSWRHIETYDLELREFGRSLMAAMVAMMIIIGTTSPILHIPTVYWILSGLCIGCARVCMAVTPRAESKRISPKWKSAPSTIVH